MNRKLRVGDKLRANFSDTLDKVTKDNIYEVAEVFQDYGGMAFKIINDNGDITLPINVTFRLVDEDRK